MTDCDLIDEHMRHLHARGMSSHTIDDRSWLLSRLARELPNGLGGATTEDLEGWLGNPGWTGKTRETYWSHIVPFFRWACHGQNPRLAVDPAADLCRPRSRSRLPRPVTDAQLRLALTALADPWRLAVLLAAWCGMRASEIAAAQRSDFTEERVLIYGKGGRYRAVPVHPDVWAAVHDRPTGLLVVRPNGRGGGDGEWLSHRTSRHLTRIGLPDVTLHRFRHWFGTVAQREYRDLRVTQELMGHSSPATTAGYAAVTDVQRRLAVATLPSLASVMVA